MSQANTFASFKATMSEMSELSAAWNSEESMLAVAVRTRMSTGLLSILAAKPASSRTTFRVCVSLTLRDSSLMPPAVVWVTLMASPGFK